MEEDLRTLNPNSPTLAMNEMRIEMLVEKHLAMLSAVWGLGVSYSLTLSRK